MANGYQFLAGVGRALLFKNNNLIGVAKTLTESSFNFEITSEEIRGGSSNALWGKYFHDSSLTVTLTDAMFNLEYIAAALGVNVESGGLSVKEEELTVGATAGQVALSETAVAFDGSMIGWYKKPTDTVWSIATIGSNGTVMTIPSAATGDVYCVKYEYINADAKSITIKTQYVPSELHVVILNDLFSGDANEISSATRYGRLITDIPRLQLDGNQNLQLTATSAATVDLTGSALAVSTTDTCEEDPYYGTMTQEIYGTSWKDDVQAITAINSEITLAQNGEDTALMYVVFGGSMPSVMKANSNFTFAVETNPAATATGVTVDTDGKISAGAVAGTAVISATLTGYDNVAPAYIVVTVE